MWGETIAFNKGEALTTSDAKHFHFSGELFYMVFEKWWFFFLLSLADHVVVSVSLSLLILFPALTFEIIAVCVLVLTDRSFNLNY